MAIQIGKYKRPGIFLEEYDNSVIATPVVEGITNLVIGVSKKGPVNTPIRINTGSDLETVFGPLDRGLERKGSFFHRTVSKMLETAPVFAMNLLLTDDTLDTIEYKSISASSNLSNDIERLGAYRRFHDTTGFWKRDTEAFLNLTKSNTGYTDRAFSLTNLSDRYATVFVFNSMMTGFDRTLIEWYGSQEKVPPFVNPNDWASDYMVDVVIVAGDWSDYRALAVDPRWSAYFNSTGLRKEQIRNFANDRNITTLAYYEGLSLIPYFRDSNGRNIFIETTINRDTDRTGIFCAFNSDLVEVDFYNGKLDIIGQTIAGTDKESLDFLSYQDTIREELAYAPKPLDLPGNVTALLGAAHGSDYGDATFGGSQNHTFGDGSGALHVPRTSGLQRNYDRTTFFAEDFVRNVSLSFTASITATASPYFPAGNTMSVAYRVNDLGGHFVINDSLVQLSAQTATMSVNGMDFATSSATMSMTSAFILDSTGAFKILNGSKSGVAPTPASSDTVLGYANYDVYQQEIKNVTMTEATHNVTVGYDLNGVSMFRHLEYGVDYDIFDLGSGRIRVEFLNTNDSPKRNEYKVYRRFKAFNRLVGLLDSSSKDRMTMLINRTTMEKASCEAMTISNIVTSVTANKRFDLDTGISSWYIQDVLNYGMLVFYTTDNELLLGHSSLVTTMSIGDSTTGVVAKYSDMYQDFYDGRINSGDFIYNNRIIYNNSATQSISYAVKFIPGETAGASIGTNTGPTTIYAGNDYLVFDVDPEFNLNEVIKVKGSVRNTGNFTILNQENANLFGQPGKFVYRVNENTTYESITSSYIYKIDEKVHFLKMWFGKVFQSTTWRTTDVMNVNFTDSLLTTTEPLYSYGIGNSARSSWNLLVNSADTNYKQTIEIEVPSGYTEVPNKVLVNAARYTEIVKGDFLEADYDETLLAIGEVPRKMTRILKKAQYVGDTSLVEITCDAKIKKVFTGEIYQTTRYRKVENYIETYKAVSLKGFRVRQASMPDGSEERQTQILNMVAKGTTLFKALTNKEAIDFRYLIDSFGNGLIEKSKQQLVDICGERLDAFGFINMPSMRAFKNSSSPSFVNSEGVLQAEFIAKGADPESGPAFLYSFGEGAGTTCTGYFLPYLKVNDNGRPLDFPPASFVATTYMRKHTTNAGGITPWTIAAGVTNGRITGITGLEIDFTPSDIEYLNQAQMNPIVFKRNRGNVIETENTAQTLYKSALSYIHVREVLIELERELSRMLLDYQWKFNTSDIRAEIKLRADVICEGYVSRNGLYNYFNKMDDENNTPEIIDNQIGVLDTYVEPIKGMGVIVNNVTILRTGAIASGGFQ